MFTRTAKALWEGGLKDGKGSFSTQSGEVGGRYSFVTRFADEKGSNPEELLAAAEAACFSMALSGALERAGSKPSKIETSAACSLETVDGKPTITSIKVDTTVTVSGMSDDEFQKVAQGTIQACPVSRTFHGNVKIEVTARMAQ